MGVYARRQQISSGPPCEAPAVQADTHYAKSGDLSIAYQVWGDGPIDLVCVPGIVSHVEFFHELPGYTDYVRRLARFARVLVFDKRGSGLSDRPDRVGTLEERIDDMRAVMDAVGSERAAVLGFSEGGPMSALYAATHPDRGSHLELSGADPAPEQATHVVLVSRPQQRFGVGDGSGPAAGGDVDQGGVGFGHC